MPHMDKRDEIEAAVRAVMASPSYATASDEERACWIANHVAGRRSSPWGHKVTVHIYVLGDLAVASDVSHAVVAAGLFDDDERVAFMGVSIDNVRDEPKDMVAT
jgi:hypothetical protein